MKRATPVSARSGRHAPVRLRDADRSREAILDAAEDLFAQRGYDSVALGEIAAEADLSRGTPSYFFGSKAELYTAVLERAFAQRELAARDGCAPVVDWAQRDGDPLELRGALTEMTGDYMAFLLAHPAFVALMVREGLDGGARLRDTPHESQAMAAMFEAVNGSLRRRKLRPFRTADAVLLLLGLTFATISYRDTYVAGLGIDLRQAAQVSRHVALVVDQLISLILHGGEERP